MSPSATLTPADLFRIIDLEHYGVKRGNYHRLWKVLRNCKVPVIESCSGHKTVTYGDVVKRVTIRKTIT